MTIWASLTRRRSFWMPSRRWWSGGAPRRRGGLTPAPRAAERTRRGRPLTERVTEIYSLLAPLVDVGTVPGNGKVVPLVSFEGACGQMIPPASGRTRIVILHALGTRVEGGKFA